MSETYLRVCVLPRGHAGEHLPYRLAPDKDEFRNKEIAQPRCLHVDPVALEHDEHRYRVVFELFDRSHPSAGWHEVARETHDLADAREQIAGLLSLEAHDDDVRSPRLERAVLRWELAE
jgi:hypothetical protein